MIPESKEYCAEGMYWNAEVDLLFLPLFRRYLIAARTMKVSHILSTRQPTNS